MWLQKRLILDDYILMTERCNVFFFFSRCMDTAQTTYFEYFKTLKDIWTAGISHLVYLAVRGLFHTFRCNFVFNRILSQIIHSPLSESKFLSLAHAL